MKRFVFGLIFVAVNAQARQITLEIPDRDIVIVENDVSDAEEWIKAAWAGKVNKCKERMVRNEVDRSVREGSTLPTGEAAIIAKALKRSDYKNRKQRDLAEQK